MVPPRAAKRFPASMAIRQRKASWIRAVFSSIPVNFRASRTKSSSRLSVVLMPISTDCWCLQDLNRSRTGRQAEDRICGIDLPGIDQMEEASLDVDWPPRRGQHVRNPTTGANPPTVGSFIIGGRRDDIPALLEPGLKLSPGPLLGSSPSYDTLRSCRPSFPADTHPESQSICPAPWSYHRRSAPPPPPP